MANITLDKLKTIVQSIVASVTRYKPNLSVNDPDDPRYVAGRLCYKTDPVEKTLVENETLEIAETYTESVWSFLLEEGQSYTVVWDGVTYTDVCSEYDGGYGVGNTYLYSDNAKDTGEPFYIETWDGVTSVYASETGVHTVTIVTTEPGKIIPLPQEYLPQIPAEKVSGLAGVATSGSYNDLTDQPTIPTVSTDIVRYTAQSLTTAQKTQARTNIGAGTDDYNDLKNRPCYNDEILTVALGISNKAVSCTSAHSAVEGVYYDYDIVTSSANLYFTVGAKYKVVIGNDEYTCFCNASRQRLGNASLYSTDYEDTGEPFYLLAMGTYVTMYYKGTKSARVYVYLVENDIKQLEEKVIPSTIQRVGEPLYLTDSAGAKWQLVVGTDGTLSTTAVTE